MCKVLIIPSIKHQQATAEFVALMGQKMTHGNNDGLGYAAINASGDLFGERWFKNEDAFISQKNDSPGMNSVKAWGPALKTLPSLNLSNRFGVGSIIDAAAITVHTRMATCEKSLRNVHPFVDNEFDTSVIHNGVIRNVDEFDLKLSTCDSESILISYLENGVNKDIKAVQDMVDALQGYYACGVFSRDASGQRILDVFKYNNNNLVISYVDQLETYVLATSMADVESVCKYLGYTFSPGIDVCDNFLTRLNPFTGEIIEQIRFNSPAFVPKAQTYPTAKYQGYTQYKPSKYQVDEDLLHLWTLPSTIREITEP